MLVARRVSIALKSARAPTPEQATTKLLDETEFATRAVQTASDVAAEIDDRLDGAIFASLVALALTVGTFFTGFLSPAEPERVGAALVLKDDGIASMRALCGAAREIVEGRVEVDTIGEEFTVFEVPARGCGPGGTVTLRFPKTTVRAVLVRDR